MGSHVGIVLGFLGIGILIIPFILQIYVANNQVNPNNNNKRYLEGGSGIMVVAILFFIAGIIVAKYFGGSEIAKGAGDVYGGEAEFIKTHPQLAFLAL